MAVIDPPPSHRGPRPGGRPVAGIMLAAAASLLGACVASPSPVPATVGASPTSSLATPVAASPVATSTPGATTSTGAAFARNPAPIVAATPYKQALDPADFVAGVSNPFFPLLPGTKLIYDGDEHVEVTVLPDTKSILGIAATVVHDQVFVDGELAEDTFDWFAQDRDGNVWYMGEDTKELDGGKVTSTAGSWEAGVKGAVPGIVMLALPHPGDEYRQEFLKGEAEDEAAVTALDGSVKTPAGTWSGSEVLVTEEWTPLEPDIRERKTYVRGIGLVETRTIKGGDELTNLTRIERPTAFVRREDGLVG